MSATAADRRHRRLAFTLGILCCGMVGLAFASVPLYRLFCQVTGYGGTTRVAETAPGARAGGAARAMTVRFNADTEPALPWRFEPVERKIAVRAGDAALAFYRATSEGEARVGTATFNVTPLAAGPYFNKVECFCFEEQYLAAGESADFAVSFFIDPAIADDPDTHDIRTITLSYTMFDAGEDALARYVVADAGSGTTPLN